MNSNEPDLRPTPSATPATPRLSRRALILSAAASTIRLATAADPIKVGILHSLSGTMAISETTLKDMLLKLIDQQNKDGGLLGRKLEPIVVDPASNWPLFAEMARELMTQDKVAACFGCWTSVSRKAVLPVFEELNGILFYPVQYEGQECSRNIFYTGATPNQQAIPAVDYLIAKRGIKRWVLIGTDYIYPRITNKILESYLRRLGVPPIDIIVRYSPFGLSDWRGIVSEIKEAAGSSAKKMAVISTVNGDANIAFYEELGKQNIRSLDIPVMAFSASEEELSNVDTSLLVGHLAAWNYFQSLATEQNRAFVASWQNYVGDSNRRTNDPMEAHFIAFNMWLAAVDKAGTTNADAVIDAMIGISVPNLSGGTARMLPNHGIVKPVFIGEIQADGQFKIIDTRPDVAAEVWSPYIEETKNLIGDWRPPRSCGAFNILTSRCENI